MINESYFNGDRQRAFDALSARVRNKMSLVKMNSVSVSYDTIRLPQCIMEMVEKKVGSDYLIPFSCEAKKIKEIPGVLVEYETPGNFFPDLDKLVVPGRKVTLDYKVVCAVTESIWTRQLDFSCGVLPNNGFIPPSNFGGKIGQHKLLCDFLLSVDRMLSDKKNIYSILVVGSSSPGGVRSGISYTMLPYICSANITMYDPYEVTRKYTVVHGDNKVNYNICGKALQYVNIPRMKEKFDLVLDDSWVQGVSRNDRDLDDVVSTFKHFSVKQFPWERGRKGNVYNQKFLTYGLEERRVSRDVNAVSEYDHPGLGGCALCRELRLRLVNRYSEDYYKAVMERHVRNCITGARDDVNLVVDFEGWIAVTPFLIDYDNYCSLNYDYFYGTKMVSSETQGIDGMRFIFSSKNNIPERILSQSFQVLVCVSEKEYYVSKLVSEIPLGTAAVGYVQGVINLAHSKGVRSNRARQRHKNKKK